MTCRRGAVSALRPPGPAPPSLHRTKAIHNLTSAFVRQKRIAMCVFHNNILRNVPVVRSTCTQQPKK